MFSAPSAGATDVSGYNTSHTSIMVQWGLIPEEDRNGEIIKYSVKYWKDGGPQHHKEVSGDKLQAEITGLDWYSVYNIRVAGITLIGTGVYSDAEQVMSDEWRM